jgi:hypothetical protein
MIALAGALSAIGGLITKGQTFTSTQKQGAALSAALAGDLHNATAIAEFASQTSLPDWQGWSQAWQSLITQNSTIALEAYQAARPGLKPTQVPTGATAGANSPPALSTAADKAAAATGLPLWALLLLGVGLAVGVYFVVKKAR